MAKLLTEEEIKNEYRSKVYNALSSVSREISSIVSNQSEVEEKYMQEAFEWYMIHFYDENNIN